MRGQQNTISDIMGRLIIQENGCCLWTGTNTRKYGRVRYKGRYWFVHRLLYEHFVGPVPDGYQLDHIHCSNPACANFAHLKVVTPAENTLRSTAASAVNARKTHCKYGHPYSGDNVHVTPWGFRWCRECDRIRGARRRVAKRERQIAAGTYRRPGRPAKQEEASK